MCHRRRRNVSVCLLQPLVRADFISQLYELPILKRHRQLYGVSLLKIALFFYYICNKVPISSRKEPSALLKSSGLKCIFNSLSYVSAEVPPTISELLTQQRSAVARSSDALM